MSNTAYSRGTVVVFSLRLASLNLVTCARGVDDWVDSVADGSVCPSVPALTPVKCNDVVAESAYS